MPKRINEKPLVAWGHPHVLKNRKSIIRNRRTGNLQIISNKKVEDAMKRTVEDFSLQWKGSPLDFPISLQIRTYIATRSDSGRLPDASNLYELPQDALEHAGVIVNDRLVQHHDGSRRICLCDTCDKRPLITRGINKGKRKGTCGMMKRCPYERIEIIIMDERDEPSD